MDSALLRDVACPACGGWQRKRVVQEGAIAIERCACGQMFSSPQLTEAGRTAFINADYKPDSVEAQYAAITPREQRYVAKTAELLGRANGAWLDIGCAVGVLLTQAQQAGFQPAAFEVFTPYEAILKSKPGWDIRIADSLDAAQFTPKSFDVISILDTLNYIADPVSILCQIHALLKDDGILLCMVPNSTYMLLKNTGLPAYLRWRKWSHMHTDQYLIHFTSKTLRAMLEHAGFKVVKEDIGAPWMKGNPLRRLAKASCYGFAKILHHFGINIGVRLDMWARKS